MMHEHLLQTIQVTAGKCISSSVVFDRLSTCLLTHLDYGNVSLRRCCKPQCNTAGGKWTIFD